MSDAASHPRLLELPRDERGLATETRAVRRMQQLLPVFLEQKLRGAGADGFVVLLDGSVDATVATALAIEATSEEQVLGLVMPARMSDESSARAAEAVASMLDIESHRMQLQPLLSAFQQCIGTTGPADDLVATRNACERFRMTCLYYVANTTNRLVLGSINRTQRLLGSMTKHGENGVDIAPLSDIYRTEVEALAEGLAVPEEILDGQYRQTERIEESDAERLGIEPSTLDSLLYLLIDTDRDHGAIADRLQIDRDTVQQVEEWCSNTRHKRHPPLKPSFDL